MLRWPLAASTASTAVALLVSSTGCTPVVATYPKCEVPVLLSKVNRIGVAKPAPVRETGTEDVLAGSVEQYVSVSQSSETHGNRTTTTTTTIALRSAAMGLSVEVLADVRNAADEKDSDIQLDSVWTGDFALVSPSWAMTHTWADPKGRKVWVR